VPGLIHYPAQIKQNKNVSTPATTADFLPTIMAILKVTSDNPTWTMDGLDLMGIVNASAAQSTGVCKSANQEGGYFPRPKVMGFDCTGGQHALIDNNWKILHKASMGQCTGQPPYNSWKNLSTVYLLFDLDKV
jgi:arylsulfatase A-like enzyme